MATDDGQRPTDKDRILTELLTPFDNLISERESYEKDIGDLAFNDYATVWSGH